MRTGCWFLYLPPYSPDLNPIEQAFSKLKSHQRRIGARSFTGLFQALGEVCDLFTPEECWNYFCQAKYASTGTENALASPPPNAPLTTYALPCKLDLSAII